MNQYGLVRFSFIFTTTEEFKTIQNIVYDYRKEIEKKEIPNEYRNTFLLFQLSRKGFVLGQVTRVTDARETYFLHLLFYLLHSLFLLLLNLL